ncbi:leucine-rich repeat protein [Butyrivibrio sp. AC2005]|uniref:leucine-rich repeat protein n=1 Tax=Butyrivibrio sp. AC2005 TaxID=1280672 RepID=UPI0004140506|nr:leucine-rich repeat protein [Butyrivibrio sp. AC2005]
MNKIRKVVVGIMFSLLIIFAGLIFVGDSAHAASSNEVTIKVAPKAKKKTITIYEGQKVQLVVKDGKKKLKSNKLTYKSDNTYYAKVSKKGVITAKNGGKVKITVTTKDKKKSCIINLKVERPISASSIQLSDEEINLNQGQTYRLTAVILPDNTFDKTIEWESSDPSIATVTNDGVVIGVSSGRTSIWAYNKKNGAYVSDFCYVNVKGYVYQSGMAGANVTYSLSGYEDDLTLELSGSGLMTNYSGENQPWYDYKHQITRIVVNNGITSIGDYSFYFCTALKTVDLPGTVSRIGKLAFCDCKELSSITLPNSLTTIDSRAFWDCYGLTNVTIPASVTYMGDEVFQDCKNITYANIEADFSTLPEGIFWGCSNLLSVRIPAVSFVDSFALYECPNLTTIYYRGTYEQWQNVQFSNYNDSMNGKAVYYNS